MTDEEKESLLAACGFLESALQRLRAVAGVRGGTAGEFTGMRMTDCAAAVLREGGNRPLSAARLAEEIKRRGYVSNHSQAGRVTTAAASLMALLHGDDRFVCSGRGPGRRYRLAGEGPPC